MNKYNHIGSFKLYRNFTNEEIIKMESELDFRDPDLYQEIFDRAEEFETGITEKYMDSFGSCVLNSDEIFERAIKYLKNDSQE